MPANWTFEETAHAGAEHLDPAQARRYDEKIPFDPGHEVELLRERGVSETDTIIDFGTGTGVFALAIAPYCRRVVGVDVAEPMLEIARAKRDERGLDNIEFVRDGFLSYEHEGDPATVAFSKNALHHLPDFWKVEALKTVGDTLVPGGILRLRDLVYSFDPHESTRSIEGWIDEMRETAFTEEELYAHFRQEFSTYGFLLEEMLTQTGFEIREQTYSDGFYAAYTCRL